MKKNNKESSKDDGYESLSYEDAKEMMREIETPLHNNTETTQTKQMINPTNETQQPTNNILSNNNAPIR